MKPEVMRQVYLNAHKMVSDISCEIQDLKIKLQHREDSLKKFRSIEEETQEFICPSCCGIGDCVIWYAQDDSKIETCGRCKGTGLR